MIISKATPEEYNSVRFFYHSLIDGFEGSQYHPMWQKDIYPAPEELKSAIVAGELYIARLADRIAAAMVLNPPDAWTLNCMNTSCKSVR